MSKGYQQDKGHAHGVDHIGGSPPELVDPATGDGRDIHQLNLSDEFLIVRSMDMSSYSERK